MGSPGRFSRLDGEGTEKPRELAMIDPIARAELAEALRHLVSGQSTNDAFEERVPLPSEDPAIHAIYGFAWLLYDDLRTYRLRGRDRLAEDDRTLATRAIVFLHSDLESTVDLPTAPASLLLCLLLLLLGATLGTIAWLNLIGCRYVLAFAFGLPAAFLLIQTIRTLLTNPQRAEQWRAFEASGAWNVWPFATREQFSKALGNPCLLSGRPRKPANWALDDLV